MGRLNVPLEVLTVTTRILPSVPGWTSLMTVVGQWSGVEPCCPPSGSQDLQVGCCGMSDASVGDVAAHGGSQQTTFSRSSGVVVEMSATWTIYSV